MLDLLPTDPAPPGCSIPMFTLRGTITTSGQSVAHTQYLAPEFVVTEFGRSVVVHSRKLGGRFVVDSMERRLRPVDLAGQRVQVQHLQEIVGTIAVHIDEQEVELDGFTCRRYRLCNDAPRIVVAAEAFCTRLPAIAATALHEERRFEAELHPFALPLQPDEVVVRSTTRTFTNGFQHTQRYQLDNLHAGIQDVAALEGLLEYPIAGR